MQAARSAVSLVWVLRRLGWCIAVGSAIAATGGRSRADDPRPARPDRVALGYEIFNREWLPDDPRSHGGDGLGPVYNDTSCVACHNAGGSGGAGPVSKNIDILSASRGFGVIVSQTRSDPPRDEKAKSPVPTAGDGSASRDALSDLHAAFRTSRTAVLHKFGTDPNYDAWRTRAFSMPAGPQESGPAQINVDKITRLVQASRIAEDVKSSGNRAPAAADSAATRAQARIQEIRTSVLGNLRTSRPATQAGGFLVSRSQRNPTPLFGLGLIDAIPDAAIEKIAIEEARTSPDTKGRVGRLKDGRIGRLGWKGQTASTEDFVLNACAVELGLEVPGHAQAVVPQAPKYRSPGLDLDTDECAALVAYVRSLPAPVERRSTAAEANYIKAGKAVFTGVGCANCHAPKLGDVAGIYSDLLLHDMGSEMGDDGSYDPGDPEDPSNDPPTPNPDDGAVAARRTAPARAPITRTQQGATKQEWRTPPLWGFRDSGPYLHDGRAQTLEQAVAMHGGQGESSAQKFFELSPRERLQIETFLKSLVAPPPVQLARRGE